MSRVVIIVHICLLTLFCVSYVDNNLPMLSTSVYLLLIFNVSFALLRLKERFVFFCFNIIFFTFLVSQMMLGDMNVSNDFSDLFISNFTNEIKRHIYVCLFLSLAAIFWGYLYFDRKQSRMHSVEFSFNNYPIYKLRRFSKKIMYFFLFFAFIESLEKAIYVQRTGYFSYYTDFQSQLPFFVSRLAHFYELSVFLFLATLPKKKAVKTPLLLFFIVGCMSMGYGQRNGFVLNALFVVIYFVFRDYKKFYGKNEVWVTKKFKYALCIGVPFLLIFLVVFGSARFNEKTDANLGFIDLLLGFFYSQGTSYRIIGYDMDYASQFPSSFPYSLGYFVDLYQQNYIFKLFGVYPSYESHSIDAALHGHNYGDVITYLYNSNAYLQGYGLGSCYIAEMYHDFGYLGVIFLNFIYGVIICSLNRYALRSVWMLFLFFCMILNILYAPRSAALTFLSEVVAISFILFFLFVRIIYRKYEHKAVSA